MFILLYQMKFTAADTAFMKTNLKQKGDGLNCVL